jgi:hypothetical protein
MPAHKSHGREYIEPPRHDELPAGIAIVQASASHERKATGQIDKGAQDIPSAGGRARKGRTRLSHEIGASKLTPTSQSRARTLRRALSGEIASSVGGGFCGIAASLLIKFAAQKTAAAEEAFERGDYETHRKLSESARMDVLYAREHAAKEAAARASKIGVVNPLDAWDPTKAGE